MRTRSLSLRSLRTRPQPILRPPERSSPRALYIKVSGLLIWTLFDRGFRQLKMPLLGHRLSTGILCTRTMTEKEQPYEIEDLGGGGDHILCRAGDAASARRPGKSRHRKAPSLQS